jgi:beta-lactamase class A
VFTNSSMTPESDREWAIAEVARALYDFYYLQS